LTEEIIIQAADFQRALQLTLLSPSTKKEWDIRTADLNRPGMQFCGFYEYFAFERPQVIGKVEMTYLEELSPKKRRTMLEKYFSFVACGIYFSCYLFSFHYAFWKINLFHLDKRMPPIFSTVRRLKNEWLF
jgi:HPr kinase/phosphorylase